MEHQKWQKRASIVICIAAAAVVAWLAIKYLLWAVLPFFIAWLVALIVTPLARWVSSKSGLPRKLCAAVLLVALLGVLCGGLSWLVQRLITELGRLMTWLRNQGQSWDDQAFQMRLDSIVRRIPFIGKLLDSHEAEQWREHIVGALIDAVGRTLGGLAGLVPSAILSTVSKLPSLLLTLLITLIACFYFVIDLDKIHAAITAVMPTQWADAARYFKHRVGKVLRRFVRAYFVLFVINFGVLSVGFAVLRIDCVLLMALVCALVDILPVLGAGAVILPWAAWMMLVGDYFLGIGLAIVYVVVTVIHQLAEPYVLGGSLGVHPLIILVAMYVGFQLFGIVGMLAFPAVSVLAVSALPAKQ